MTITMTRREWRRDRARQQRIKIVGYGVAAASLLASAGAFLLGVAG